MNLTNKNFQHVLDTNEVVLVDFWADWCAPCKMLSPSINQLKNEFDGRAIVGKVNTTVENALAARYGIRSLPTILIFKDGKIAEQLTGVRPKTQYADKLNYYLN
tara:strand:+ start:9588 stop:9899 length:312 start_codon:yes stop_codon:yes gene_type:complete